MSKRAVGPLKSCKTFTLTTAVMVAIVTPFLLGQAKPAQRMTLAALESAPPPFQAAAHSILAGEQRLSSSQNADAQEPAKADEPDIAAAQSSAAAEPFKFDVVSIRPSDPNVRPKLISFQFTDDGFVATNQSLLMTLLFQYQTELQLDASRIVGGPDWMRTLSWDIHAKVSASDIGEWSKLSHDSSTEAKERRRATIQAMLADRFKLKTHVETREGTVYALVIAKGGPKVKPSSSDGPVQMHMKHEGHLVVERVEIGALVPLFAQELGHLVIDKTGLTGKYDLTLDWAPAQSTTAAPVDVGHASAASDSTAPSIFTALQEQLGLKLEVQKGPAEYVVIDHLEKPTEN